MIQRWQGWPQVEVHAEVVEGLTEVAEDLMEPAIDVERAGIWQGIVDRRDRLPGLRQHPLRHCVSRVVMVVIGALSAL